ncbi:MAG: leucyl aminopeptidase [Desulfobacterales bacterium]|nr:leucyl aminopeptidase [Desulfobacterales bacterium]
MLELIAADLKKETIGTLLVPVCENRDIHDLKSISAIIKEAKKIQEFKGEADDELVLYHLPEIKAARVVFMGLGKADQVDAQSLRRLAGKGVKKCIHWGTSDVWIAAPSAAKLKMEPSSLLASLMEGAVLGNHIFDKYKNKKKLKPLKKIHLLAQPARVKELNRLPGRIQTLCDGTILARDWVNTPSNDKKPDQFARAIVALAKNEDLKVTVLNEKELAQKKFGALLAVAAGSENRPRLVLLEYAPRGAKKTIAFVGKGITFDSGGINLKSSSGLEGMKADMSGAAAVAALLLTVAKLKPAIRVIGAMPLVENMPSGAASRPGDIVKSYCGKTVEIGNTDAEGRLILIDAMSYVIEKYQPETLIDMATLTGACVVALGEKIAGVFSPHDNLAQTLVRSGEKTFERCWRLPLPEDYRDQLKSDMADISNVSSSRWGGAITGALFLSEFIQDTKWAHIDIAGPSYQKKENAYCGAGATGFGVRLLYDLLENL